MKLSTLKYFVEVAAENSFTKTAEKLYISQPTLSRRIQELEMELGVDLFIRQSHSLRLTSAGEQFLVEVSDVLNRINHLSHMFDNQELSTKSSPMLKIGYLANFNMGRMYELFEQFKLTHPTIQFLMKQDTPMSLAEGLSDGQYDLVFNLFTYLEPSKNIKNALFMTNHLQVAVPVNHPLSNKKKLHFEDLKQENVILLERQQSPVIVDYVVSQCIKHGFNVKANSYVKELDEGLAKVSVGKGLAFLYSGMDDGTLEEKYHIKIIDLESDSRDQNIVAAFNQENDNPLLQELFQFLQEHLTEK